MQLCGWSHRGSVTRVVRRKNGVFRNLMSSTLRSLPSAIFKPTFGIASEQLLNEWFTKKRSKRARGLVRDERYDTTCPVCGQYAVYEPLTNQ